MNLDVTAYEDIDTAELPIKDPVTGNSTGAVFVIAGPEHDIRRRLRKAEQRRMQRALEKYNRIVTRDPDEQEQDETDMLVASTLGWSGVVAGKEPLAFNAENVRKLYTDPKRRWLRDFVLAALNERDRFIRRSVQTS